MKGQYLSKFLQNRRQTFAQKDVKAQDAPVAPSVPENAPEAPVAPYGKLELLSAPAQSQSDSPEQFVPLSQGIAPAERLHEARETLKHLQELQNDLVAKKRKMVEDFQRTAKRCKRLVRRGEEK